MVKIVKGVNGLMTLTHEQFCELMSGDIMDEEIKRGRGEVVFGDGTAIQSTDKGYYRFYDKDDIVPEEHITRARAAVIYGEKRDWGL